MKSKKLYILIILVLCIVITSVFITCGNLKKTDSKENTTKKNVVFIMVDDLRPELSIYGQDQMITPHIESLAKEGITFNRAYCNVPVCGASRASLLTGVRPTSTRFLDYGARIDEDMPNVPTFAKQFKLNGYYTISNSKILHHPGDAKGSWNEEWWPERVPKIGWRDYISDENMTLEKNGEHGYPYESPDVLDEAYFDGKTANKTIADLKKLKASGKPFFLAAGFVKPHLPFNAPKKYWDLYSADEINLPENSIFPKSAPEIANHKWGELRYYKGIPKKGPVPENIAKKLIHGYYASVSFIDAQIGKVLKTLDELDLRENTIIVITGDHGWSLSEHGLWAKHSNFEVALRVPLIISAPGYQKNKRTNSIAELVDLYPTLCELANIPTPAHVQGISLVNALQNPSKIVNNTAWTRWHNGETLITDNYFYTEWKKNGKSIDKMLYDHTIDPDENRNLAVEESYQNKVDSLSSILNNRIEKYYKSELKN